MNYLVCLVFVFLIVDYFLIVRSKKKLEEELKYYKDKCKKYQSFRGMKNTALEVSESFYTKDSAKKYITDKILAICMNRPKDVNNRYYQYQGGLLDALEFSVKIINNIK